jgi:hypothetical protein
MWEQDSPLMYHQVDLIIGQHEGISLRTFAYFTSKRMPAQGRPEIELLGLVFEGISTLCSLTARGCDRDARHERYLPPPCRGYSLRNAL